MVVGAANLDRMAYVAELPAVGATACGVGYEEHPGGKGANQAAAAALWGAPVNFAGCVGADEAGGVLRDALRRAGVNLELLQTHPAGTGLAMDFIDREGRYQAVVTPRANLAFAADQLPTSAAFWQRIGVVVLQREFTDAANAAVGSLAHRQGIPVWMNAAPASPIPAEWWRWISVLIVNEGEAAVLAAQPIRHVQEAQQAAQRLSARGPAVALTLGAAGVVLCEAGVVTHLPGHQVAVVSTLGAGDAFVGALAAEWLQDQDLSRAASLANAAAAASVQRSGAQPSYIRKTELSHWLPDGG